ncbi:hypothetical protein J2S59_000243 [Nocardioides massiliensis]|uniref:Uncharacterized protein n=1 Tax=Nocardioides massiliensis TaxID=1325935 RepID=A0ABT9NJ60_9ACTN|nr:hypothetical protein [Nocardioides massiliensis]
MSFQLMTALLMRMLDPDLPRDERGDVPGWVMVTIVTVA